jgi:2Fe-2S ferredoxin
MPKVVFLSASGADRWEVEAKVGQSILEVAHANNIAIEGACEGSLVCSTCHVIVDKAYYDRLLPPSEEEEDLLDLAYDLAATSRLGCQIIVTDKLDGLVVRLPRTTNNLMY